MNAGEIDSVLKVDDFDVSNALEVGRSEIHRAGYPFYWADVYELTHQFYDLRLHAVAFSKMKIVMLPLPEGTNALDDLRDEAIRSFPRNQSAYRMGDACARDVSSSSSKPELETRRFVSKSNHPESSLHK
jgi:hypothetical protein